MTRYLPLALALCLVGGTTAAQQVAVVPPTFASTNGSASAFPWNSAGQQRVMYVYEGQLFPALPLTITQLSWRPVAGTSAVGPATFTVDLTLSTTQYPANALDLTFDNNHGQDKTLVFSGSFTVNVPAVTPFDFTHDLTLQTPFTFDPSLGNFLIDIQSSGYTGSGTSSCDGAFNTGLGVGRIANTSSRTATQATFPGSGTQDFAYVIELTYTTCSGRVTIGGTGCADSGGTVNSLRYNGCPDLGAMFNVEYSISPSHSGPLFLIFGISDQNWGGIVLPLDLGGFGAPGCFNLVSHEFALGGLVPVAGLATLGLQMPSTPYLVGATSYLQGFHLDPAANQLNLVTTNALGVTIG